MLVAAYDFLNQPAESGSLMAMIMLSQKQVEEGKILKLCIGMGFLEPYINDDASNVFQERVYRW